MTSKENYLNMSRYKYEICDRAAANERFGVMAAEARRNGSANLKVCTPQEVQWKPPLRQAATTLYESRRQNKQNTQ